MKRLPTISYIGSKHRVAGIIGKHLRATGAETLVELFGGTAAVCLHGGFAKRVYNDLDGDLVNMFRVFADRAQRRELLNQARWMPASRQLFTDYRGVYVHGGNSFALLRDPVQRALATLYRLNYAYGSKLRSGGFQVSVSDRPQTKEVQRWFTRLRRIVELGEHLRNTVLEELPFQEVIRRYGQTSGVIFYADPPYFGTENYYSRQFPPEAHAELALLLAATPAAAAVSYYDVPQLRDLYPPDRWNYHPIISTVNCRNKHSQKRRVAELLLVKKGFPA